MVKEENVHYYIANKYVLTFLAEHGNSQLVEEWKSNSHKFKNKMRLNKKQFPVRPQNEYIFFCQEFRPKVVQDMMDEKIASLGPNDSKDNIKIDIHQVTCKLGQMWSEFKTSPNPDPQLKQKLTELAEADNKRYHEEKEKTVLKKNSEKNHLRSPYLFYCSERRKVVKNINMKTLGQEWREFQKNIDPDFTERYEKAKQEQKE